MTSKVIGGKKIDWEIVSSVAILVSIIGFAIGYIIIGASEGNGMVIFGLASLVAGLVILFDTNWGKKDGRAWRLVLTASFLSFFLASPFLHVAGNGKVWMVDGETTLSNSVLVRWPFTPLATSVSKDKSINFSFTAKTKEGILIGGIGHGAFRITSDGQELVSRMGAMKDPDVEVSAALLRVIDQSLSSAFARRSISDLSAATNLAIEFDVGSALAVGELGLRRNGAITVSRLHPHFVDR